MNTCIRALCNSDVKREGVELGKDVSLSKTYIRLSQNSLRELGGKPPSKRSILAFFSGQMHGDVRPILLQHWENKNPSMKIFRKLAKSKGNRNYINYMKSSKYCICPKGYEVNSPRVAEAIFHQCVPVIISDNFVPPFFEILNWESFVVFVQEKDITNLKNILLNIPNRNGLLPLQIAAQYGRRKIVKNLYDASWKLTDDSWTHEKRSWLVQKCVECDLFDVARKILEDCPQLASDGSVLGALARKPVALNRAKPNFILKIIKSDFEDQF